jgi:hypothetical protein
MKRKWTRRFFAGVRALAALGIGTTGASASLPVNPGQDIPVAASTSELSQAILEHVTKPKLPPVRVAARFKDLDDHGRPDLFGPPGKPVIGPPGKSGY